MHNQLSSWKTLLSKVGFGRKKDRAARRSKHCRRLRFEQCEDRSLLAVIPVNSLLDNGDGGNTTLREAIEEANLFPNHDEIKFDETVFANGGTIVLTEGELAITESVTIDGTNTNGDPLDITIQAAAGSRIFNILYPFPDDSPVVELRNRKTNRKTGQNDL